MSVSAKTLPPMHNSATSTGLPMGEHVIDGVTLDIGGLHTVRWRSDCDTCVSYARGAFAPNHDAMPGCRSGKHSHCTCDGCF